MLAVTLNFDVLRDRLKVVYDEYKKLRDGEVDAMLMDENEFEKVCKLAGFSMQLISRNAWQLLYTAASFALTWDSACWWYYAWRRLRHLGPNVPDPRPCSKLV